jgi:uncharacterized protein YbjT (DUF2867 family)
MSKNIKFNSKEHQLEILVTGATGNQGGAVTRKLIERGHIVRVFTRKPESYKAKQLEKLGAMVYKGDFEDVLTIENVMEGVDAVFAMTTPYERGVRSEVKQGFLLGKAANSLRVKHFIYSSVGSANKNTGIPHFKSKYEIENFIKSIDLNYTIIRPTYFMENFLNPQMLSKINEGILALPMIPERNLQMISIETIADFVVYILEHRERFLKQTIDIASDSITGNEVANILSEINGHKIDYIRLNYDQISSRSDYVIKMYKWLNEIGFDVDIQSLHKRYPEISWLRFNEWAKHRQWIDIRKPVKQEVI